MDNKRNLIIEKIEKWTTIFFYGFCVFVLCLITQGVIFTLANIFFLPLVLLSCFISLIFALLFLKKTQKDIQTLPKITLPIILFTSVIVSIIIFFPHDTTGGRDEASYTSMAIHLANNGTLNLPEYLNNLPGNYAESIRTKLPLYTVWLGVVYVVTGINGLFRANVLLVILGLFSFFLIVSYLSNRKIALVASVLLGSSMPFLWFMRETMTENLFFFVLWFSILSLIAYIKNSNILFLVIVFLGSLILSLTRIEGMFIQLTIIVAIIIYTIMTNRKSIFVIIISCVMSVVASLLIIESFGFSTYFLNNLEGARTNLIQDISLMVSNTNQFQPQFEAPSWQNKEMFLYRKMPGFVMVMLNKYNYIITFFSILVMTLVSFSKHKYKYHHKLYLLILFIILPEFYKIVSPSVTLDQPWFYRRYLYALLPIGYLSFALLVSFFNRRISILIVALVFAINILFSSNILFLKNNWGLTEKLEYLSKNITNNDLVMIRSWTLGYYYPASYLIMNKEIRSAFLSGTTLPMLDIKKMTFDGIPYKKIFLLSTDKHDSYTNLAINTVNSVDLSYSQLKPLCQLYEISLQEKYKSMYDYHLIPYNLATSYCVVTQNIINKQRETLYLYELVYK